ncbi:hypothetical protein KW782_02315 [Candidatus Parcubacteria bacterium]|nr:hypothetical protein [Candidatus Parcubacteria bacterium]
MKEALRRRLQEYGALRYDLESKLLGPDGDSWKQELEKFLRGELCWPHGLTPHPCSRNKPSLFYKDVVMISVPATDGLVVRDRFPADVHDHKYRRIELVSNQFADWFMDKVEEPKPERQIYLRVLFRRAVDAPIIKELGEKAELTLTDVLYLIDAQKDGRDGMLQNNEYANVFYIRDVTGILRSVFIHCAGEKHWRMGARPIDDPWPWCQTDRVFSSRPS